MLCLRRKAVESTGRFTAASRRGARQYSTAQHGKTGDEVPHSAETSKEHGHHEPGPKNESLGVSPAV